MLKKEQIDAIETKLGYVFSNKALLVQAFTRESYAKEQRVKGEEVISNEQLEYFGDSVLNYLVVSGQLDHFTKVNDKGLHVLYKEGKLSEFNSHWTDKTMLSDAIDALGFAQYLIMSKGDINQKAQENKSVKEDLFEALVGAMWIDSQKDTSKIQDVVFNMLNIEFITTNVEKNYVSQLIEYADKYKYKLEKHILEIEGKFKCIYELYMDDLPDKDEPWNAEGYGNNIKQAEQNAASNLISKLSQFGFYNLKELPKIKYDTDNAINVLQELNQKGFIGEITYQEELCFSTEKKPYWKVICKINNYVVTFIGTNESKKMAKKNAAYDALCFIYNLGKTSDYNPEKKYFRFLVEKEQEFKVFIVDSFDDNFILKGHIFPDNQPFEYFSGGSTIIIEDRWIETFEDGKKAILEHMNINGDFSNIKEPIGESYKAKVELYIEEEYNKLSQEVKENGVMLRDALLEIMNKFLNISENTNK